jgi:hypothetical protein
MRNRPILILPAWNGHTKIAFPERDEENERVIP